MYVYAYTNMSTYIIICTYTFMYTQMGIYIYIYIYIYPSIYQVYADVGMRTVLALAVHLELRKGLCSIRLVVLLLHIPRQTGDTAP